jgi:hypothetical protein
MKYPAIWGPVKCAAFLPGAQEVIHDRDYQDNAEPDEQRSQRRADLGRVKDLNGKVLMHRD